MIILFLKYYSVQKTHDIVEKKKDAPVKKTVEKVVVQDPAVEAVQPVPEPLLGESLG